MPTSVPEPEKWEQSALLLTALVFTVGGIVVTWLERDEKKVLANADEQLAREKAGRSWASLLSRCVGALGRVRRRVSRWAYRQAKAKRSETSREQIDRVLRDYRKLTWQANERSGR